MDAATLLLAPALLAALDTGPAGAPFFLGGIRRAESDELLRAEADGG